MKDITAEDLGGLLFTIHHHDVDRTEKIFYFEDELLPILKALGLPEPVWGNVLTLKEFEERNK